MVILITPDPWPDEVYSLAPSLPGPVSDRTALPNGQGIALSSGDGLRLRCGCMRARRLIIDSLEPARSARDGPGQQLDPGPVLSDEREGGGGDVQHPHCQCRVAVAAQPKPRRCRSSRPAATPDQDRVDDDYDHAEHVPDQAVGPAP
jgi:hypothetical protein